MKQKRIVIILEGGLVEQVFVDEDSEILIIDKDTGLFEDEKIKNFNTKFIGDFEGTARIADPQDEMVIGNEAKELIDQFNQQ